MLFSLWTLGKVRPRDGEKNTTFSIMPVLWLLLAAAMVQGQTSTASIGNQVTNTTSRGAIAGRVLGEDGQPLADVSVNVSALGSGRTLRRTASTDDEGNLRSMICLLLSMPLLRPCPALSVRLAGCRM